MDFEMEKKRKMIRMEKFVKKIRDIQEKT